MRLRVPAGSWLRDILRTFNIVYSPGYEPSLSDALVPVFVTNPANVTNNVTQFGDSWTSSQRAFIGGVVIGPGGAGTNATAQLVNPASSGVDLFLDTWEAVTVTASASVQLRQGCADLALPAQASGCKDMLFTSAVAKGLFKGGQPVTAAIGGTIIANVNTPGAGYRRVTMSPPVRIPPGFTFTIVNPTANEQMNVGMEWRESPSV